MTEYLPADRPAGAAAQVWEWDPNHGQPLPEALAVPAAVPLVLLVAAGANRVWVTDVAVELASEAARRGRRIVLADLQLDEPSLHERLGVPNHEGITDIFLYGASLSRSARPAPSGGFFLITAGTPTADAGDVLRHPRWVNLVRGFSEAGATLLVLVPAETDGLPVLARHAGEVVGLGPLAAEAIPATIPLEVPVRGTVVPVGTAIPLVDPDARARSAASPVEESAEASLAAAGAVSETDPLGIESPFGTGVGAPLDPDDDFTAAGDPRAADFSLAGTVVSPLDSPTLPTHRESVPAGSLGRTAPARPVNLSEPPPPERSTGASEGRRPSPLLVALLVLTLVGVAAYLAWQRLGGTQPEGAPVPGATAQAEPLASPAPARGAEPAESAAPAPGPEPVAAAGVALPYTISIKAYESPQAAAREAARQARRARGTPFYVSPEVVQGTLFYRVFAGLLPDSAAASALRERLVSARVIDEDDDPAGGSGAVVEAPLAFEFADLPDSVAAAALGDSLDARRIPTYAVPIPTGGGSRRWRLYGGAFVDTLASEGMRRALAEAGLPGARLVTRTGAPPAPR